MGPFVGQPGASFRKPCRDIAPLGEASCGFLCRYHRSGLKVNIFGPWTLPYAASLRHLGEKPAFGPRCRHTAEPPFWAPRSVCRGGVTGLARLSLGLSHTQTVPGDMRAGPPLIPPVGRAVIDRG